MRKKSIFGIFVMGISLVISASAYAAPRCEHPASHLEYKANDETYTHAVYCNACDEELETYDHDLDENGICKTCGAQIDLHSEEVNKGLGKRAKETNSDKAIRNYFRSTKAIVSDAKLMDCRLSVAQIAALACYSTTFSTSKDCVEHNNWFYILEKTSRKPKEYSSLKESVEELCEMEIHSNSRGLDFINKYIPVPDETGMVLTSEKISRIIQMYDTRE